MNNISNTRTSVFLDALNKDRSQIAKIDPIVVFRNILSLSDRLDMNTVYAGLQRVANSVGKQAEFQKNIVKSSFLGEVIVFDIGKDNWCQFKVVREPLPGEGAGVAINFIVSVSDPTAGKRWDRLVGAIQLEAKNKGEKPVPVFRTIKDVINEVAIEKVEISQESLKPLTKRTQPKETPPQDQEQQETDEPEKKEEEPAHDHQKEVNEMIIFHKGDEIKFIPDNTDEKAAVLESKNQSFAMVSDEFPVMRDTKSKTYTADTDISMEMLKRGFEVFGYLSLIKSEAWPKEEELEKTIIVHKDEVFRCHTEKIDSEDAELQIWNNSTDELVTSITDPDVIARTDWEKKLFVAKEDLSIGFFKHNTLDQIFEAFTEGDNPEYNVIIQQGEVVHLEEYEGSWRAKNDITAHELKTTKDKRELFELVVPQKEEQESETTETQEKEEMNNNEILYTKDQIFELESAPGKKFKALQDITVGMTRERNGSLDGLVEEVVEEQPKIADIDQPKAVGEIPDCKLCKDEHTATQYMEMLFGTPVPTILHLFNLLKNENANNELVASTGTWPTETLSVWDNYTFSIVRMKNGAFYRVHVSHTDMARVQDGTASYLKSANEKDRWFTIGNIQDRDVSQILNRRRA